MVRPCAKYARLDCYAPLQVTAKTFAVTWSGLFTCAKLATFLGLVWGHARQNIFTETAAHRKHPTAKVPSEFFGMSHTRTSVLLGLVPRRIGGSLFTCAKLATFFGLGLGTCKTKYFYRNSCAPKTSDGKSVVGIFRHVSYTHLGTFGLGIGTWKIKISTFKCRHAAKTENSEYEKRAHR